MNFRPSSPSCVVLGVLALVACTAGCGEEARSTKTEVSSAAPEKPTSRFRGRVQCEGKPVARASVLLLRADSRLGEALTGEDGEFDLDCRGEGRELRMEVEAPGFPIVTREIDELMGSEARELEPFSLQRGVPLRGRVTSSLDKRPGVATIRLSQTNGAESWRMTGSSDEDGEFVLEGVPLGPLRVSLEAPSHEHRQFDWNHAEGRELELELAFQPTLALSIKRAPKHAAIGAHVWIHTIPDNGRPRFEQVINRPTQWARYLTGSSWDVYVTLDGYQSEHVVVSDPELATLDLLLKPDVPKTEGVDQP